jgi:hypothetical protein
VRLPLSPSAIFLTCSFLFIPPLNAETRSFRCKAVDPDHGKALFSCSGFEIRNNNKPVTAEIIYRLPSGKIFAREKINFRKNAQSPDLSLSDERDGRREMIERTANGFSILMQETGKATPEFTRLKHSDSENALTIPGLPEYVTANWAKIISGERLVFYCAFPAQKKLLRLRAESAGQIKYAKTEALLLKLQPDNFAYRWFSKPVYLTIRTRDKKLLRYQGLHYIRNPQTGGGSIVDLTFNW